MIGGVFLFGQITRTHQRNGHRIPKNHLDRSGGHRREIKGAQLALERQIDIHIAEPSEHIAVDGGDRDEIGALGPSAGNEAEKLVGVAGLAEEDEEVGGGQNADVAVEGVEGGEEGGAEAEGDEGLGDLAGDEAGLADAGEEDGAGGIEEGEGEGEGLGEVEIVEEEVEVILLGLEEIEERGFVDRGLVGVGGCGLLGQLGEGEIGGWGEGTHWRDEGECSERLKPRNNVGLGLGLGLFDRGFEMAEAGLVIFSWFTR